MDLRVIESLNGGDLVKKTKDLSIVEGFENMPYLAMFGGNVEQSTPVNRPESTQMFDWWGNSLLFTDNPSQQFNSITEKTLNEVALNSQGRILIEEAVLADLEFMREFAELEVSVSIIDNDKVEISILIDQPDNKQDKKYEFIWDQTLKSLIDTTLKIDNTPAGGVFDETFDETFA